MTKSSSLLLALVLVSAHLLAQSSAISLPAHTPLTAQIDRHIPMRLGQPVQAKLLYPVYSGTTLVLPAGTKMDGKIVAFHSDRARRIRSAFNLDFTPFHIPVVQFTQLTLPDGSTLPLSAEATTDGAVLLHLAAHLPRKKENLVHQQFDNTVHFVRDSVLFFVGPGRGDRLLQLAYHQLLWHPQRLEKGTAWTTETSQSMELASAATAPDAPQSSTIEATLNEPISSATAQPGQLVHATVAAPVFNADKTLAIPQGATLVGTITQAKPSRAFGRSGALRFSFDQVILPSGEKRSLTTNLAAADSAAAQDLALDTEGEVKPKAQDKLIIPGILLALAIAPLVPDPGDNDEFFKNAGASNSLGIMGFVAGIATNRAGVSAVFGFYGAALSINDRWIRHGTEVVFPRDTRISLETTTHHVSVSGF
jgi:hypothetical protein